MVASPLPGSNQARPISLVLFTPTSEIGSATHRQLPVVVLDRQCRPAPAGARTSGWLDLPAQDWRGGDHTRTARVGMLHG